ncbi:hypothetical protein F5883DRAFT_674526 [Diaporthe sp. PMI_573]|nr:hypothetical protein F5883DRAFT_674526 [Diaporthaceae sp. PMI_573]
MLADGKFILSLALASCARCLRAGGLGPANDDDHLTQYRSASNDRTAIKDVLAGELGVPAYSIDTVLYTRNGSAGDDETTAMGKILISFSPNVLEATEDPEAGYEVWAGAVVEDGVAKVDDRGVKWPIMYDSWKGADLTGSSTIVP